MKRILKLIKNNLLILISAVILGFVALYLVFLLPTQPMKEHIYWSLGTIEKEFTDEVIVDGNRATLTGNFTDCLMLEHASYISPNHSLLEQVLHMYRGEAYDSGVEDDWWPGQSLKDFVEGTSLPREVTYSRYWHGYLVVLKPLLLLTSFNSLRLFNSAALLILTGLVLMAMCKKGAYSLSKAFLVSLPFLFFISTFASLSLSICFYLLLFALLAQLKWDDRLFTKSRYAEFFLILGIVTSYADFLTYPLVTLGYPLCVYFYFHSDRLKENMKKAILYSAEWFFGYTVMWASKWVLADLFTGSSIIRQALHTVMTRTQSAQDTTRFEGFFRVISKNIQPYANWCYVLLGALILIMILTYVRKARVYYVTHNLESVIPYLVVALFPFMWYFVTQNHSEQHWQYTCRILAIAVFAGVTGVIQLFERQKKTIS